VTVTCRCGFKFVFGRPLERAVEVICPKCGARRTVQPRAVVKPPEVGERKEEER